MSRSSRGSSARTSIAFRKNPVFPGLHVGEIVAGGEAREAVGTVRIDRRRRHHLVSLVAQLDHDAVEDALRPEDLPLHRSSRVELKTDLEPRVLELQQDMLILGRELSSGKMQLDPILRRVEVLESKSVASRHFELPAHAVQWCDGELHDELLRQRSPGSIHDLAHDDPIPAAEEQLHVARDR